MTNIDIISESINEEVPELVDQGELYNPIVVTNKKLIEAFSKVELNIENSSLIVESAFFIKWLEMGVRDLHKAETHDTGRPLRGSRTGYMYLQRMAENCMKHYGNTNLISIAERFSQDRTRDSFDRMIDLSLDTMKVMYEAPTSNAYDRNTLLQMKDVYEKFYAPAIPLYKEAGEKVEKIQNDFYETFKENVKNNREKAIGQRNYNKNDINEPSISEKK